MKGEEKMQEFELNKVRIGDVYDIRDTDPKAMRKYTHVVCGVDHSSVKTFLIGMSYERGFVPVMIYKKIWWIKTDRMFRFDPSYVGKQTYLGFLDPTDGPLPLATAMLEAALVPELCGSVYATYNTYIEEFRQEYPMMVSGLEFIKKLRAKNVSKTKVKLKEYEEMRTRIIRMKTESIEKLADLEEESQATETMEKEAETNQEDEVDESKIFVYYRPELASSAIPVSPEKEIQISTSPWDIAPEHFSRKLPHNVDKWSPDEVRTFIYSIGVSGFPYVAANPSKRAQTLALIESAKFMKEFGMRLGFDAVDGNLIFSIVHDARKRFERL